jgi:Mitochondrial ribosomal protein (VAR1)
MMNSKYKIFLNIKSLFKKHKPLLEDNGILTKSPDLTKLNKQNLFPLTSLHRYRKESLLNKTSTAYLNSVHPTKLRVNLNEAPSKTKTKKLKYLNVAPEKQMSKSSDVIYEYLKSFSKYSNRKKGLLIKNNQHIAYNFNSKTILKRGDEALLKKIFKKSLKRLNKLKANIIQNKFTILHYIAKAKEFIKKTNKNKKFLLHIKKPSLLDLYPESNKNTSRATFAKKPRTVKNAHMDVHTEIPIDQDQDLILRLKELNSLSAKIKPNRRGNNGLIKYSYKLLFYFFKSMYCLISKPVFLFTPEKVVIQLKYFLIIPKYKVFKWYSILKFKPFRLKREALIRKKLNKKNKNKNFFKQEKNKFKFNFKPKIKWKVKRTLIRLINKGSLVQKTLFDLNKFNLFKVFSTKFKLICDILNKKFKKPVEFQLIRIHKPFNDSNILGNLLSLNIRNKKFKTKVRIKKLFKKRVVKNVSDYQNKSVNSIPTYLSGINIRIGGRLMREAFIPRISQKRFERGARSVGKVNYLDTASITNKNRKGSYTLKISSGQNFF